MLLDSGWSLPETLAAAAPAEAASVGPRLSGGLGGVLDVCRLPFSHLHSAHTPGLRDRGQTSVKQLSGNQQGSIRR